MKRGWLIFLIIFISSLFNTNIVLGIALNVKGKFVFDKPQLVYPSVGATLYSKDVEFCWGYFEVDYSNYRLAFEIETALEPTFTVILNRVVTNAFFPERGRVYCETITVPIRSEERTRILYWRIKAVFPKYEAIWSDIAYFYINLSPNIPLCIYREVRETSDRLNLDFVWEAAEGVEKYWFEIFKGSNRTTPWKTIHSMHGYRKRVGNVLIKVFSVRIPKVDFTIGERYIWRVKAYRGMGEGYTEFCGGEFTYEPEEISTIPTVSLLEPPDNRVFSNAEEIKNGVELRWSALRGVREYEVEWGEKKEGSRIGLTHHSRVSDTKINIDVKQGKDYFWRVKPAERNWISRDETRKFSVRIIPDIPRIVWPTSQSNKTTLPKPKFIWYRVPFAKYYLLDIFEGSLGGRLILSKNIPESNIGSFRGPYIRTDTLSYISEIALPPGNYVLSIRAGNEFGVSGQGAVRFTVEEVIQKKEIPTSPLPGGVRPFH